MWIVLIELFIACLFWAWGFVGTKILIQSINVDEIILLRFSCAFIILLPLSIKANWKKHIQLSFIPGLMLSFTLITQTLGLKYTSATKSAFITSLYALIVPIINFFLKNKFEFSRNFFLGLLFAILGTTMINLEPTAKSFFNFNLGLGEFLTLTTSIFAALHIISIELLFNKSSNNLSLNSWSFLWVTIFSIIFLLLKKIDESNFIFLKNIEAFKDIKILITLLSLILLSTISAFWLQIRNQKKIHSNIASIIFLLESPITLLLSFFILNERFNYIQTLGMIFIFLGCILSVFRNKSLKK